MLQVKIFAGYRYQMIEEEFNHWSADMNPFIVKTILDSAPVQREEGGHSLYFTLVVFFNTNYHSESPEVIVRPNKEAAR
jgi:hypothetical protein